MSSLELGSRILRYGEIPVPWMKWMFGPYIHMEHVLCSMITVFYCLQYSSYAWLPCIYTAYEYLLVLSIALSINCIQYIYSTKIVWSHEHISSVAITILSTICIVSYAVPKKKNVRWMCKNVLIGCCICICIYGMLIYVSVEEGYIQYPYAMMMDWNHTTQVSRAVWGLRMIYMCCMCVIIYAMHEMYWWICKQLISSRNKMQKRREQKKSGDDKPPLIINVYYYVLFGYCLKRT